MVNLIKHSRYIQSPEYYYGITEICIRLCLAHCKYLNRIRYVLNLCRTY